MSAPRIKMTLINSSVNSGVVTGNVPTDGGTYFLLRQVAGNGQHWNHHEKAAHQRRDSRRRVIPQRVGDKACEGGAVVSGGRCKRVENLAEAVRAGIRDACGPEALDHGDSGQGKNDQWENQ